MAGFGKVISLNDEAVPTPKIRKDQQRKILNIVRTNSEFPIVALGLVRDYAKSLEEAKYVQFDCDENPTLIKLHLRSASSGLYAEYQFTLSAPVRLPIPTL